VSRVWLLAIVSVALAFGVRRCKSAERHAIPELPLEVRERLSHADTFEVGRVVAAAQSSGASVVAGEHVSVLEWRDVERDAAHAALLHVVDNHGVMRASGSGVTQPRPSIALVAHDAHGSIELLFDEKSGRLWWTSGDDRGVVFPQLPGIVNAALEGLFVP